MKNKIRKTYASVLKTIFKAVNPIKKRIIKTSCIMHTLINKNAIISLKNSGFTDEYKLFDKNIEYINKGAVWADQDFRSINHFFHYEKRKGLYGFSNAYDEFIKYYKNAKEYMKKGEKEKAFFNFGVACHLLQDATVPQHVHNKLLRKHRGFELWIIENYAYGNKMRPVNEVEIHDFLHDFVMSNVKLAYKAHESSKHLKVLEERYCFVSGEIIDKAQKSTAGLMVKFYNDIM